MLVNDRHGFSRLTLVVGGVALVFLLGACENLKGQLGLTKSSPDEFSVLVRAPLSQPPDYTLRPPDPGADRPQEISVQEKVKAVLFKTSPKSGGADAEATVGESALLSLAGTSAQDSNIRATINQDNAIFAEEGGSFVDKLIFWRKPQSQHVVVDAVRENQRIQEAQATGVSPSAGSTIIIERREQGILEGLF